MTFLYPLAFTLFLPLAFAAYRILRRTRNQGLKFSAISRLGLRHKSIKVIIADSCPYLWLISLGLMIVALATPRSPIGKTKGDAEAISIAMTLDISGSMENVDMTPEGERPSRATRRIAIVKKFFKRFLENREGDLISLVTFGKYASTVVPLTSDKDLILDALNIVDIPENEEEKDGTAIGDGLAHAILRIKDSEPKTKIVILLSDGDSNAGWVKPEEATEAAAKLGIRVYTIGVGRQYVRNFFGQVIKTFDEASLRSIAEKTGGKYYSAADQEALHEALSEINRLETTPIEIDLPVSWHYHFADFLLSGVLLAFFAASVSMFARRRIA